ncbi:methionyl-tRNA formyltransferase [Candidatus Parcubacteria bacterium]|nr:MAG: methionyl-tRNA formyltransferase [Candidatus Parcubacteria bacterium]
MPVKNSIVFFGTSYFASIILKKLAANFCVLTVITQPDRPSGRKQQIMETEVKKTAKEMKIPFFQPENLNDKNFLLLLKKYGAEAGVLAAYAQIVPKQVLKAFPKGILNVHPSLLPKYRGASPVQTAIINNEKETGVSIIKLTDKLDAGPILAQTKIAINDDDNNISLHEKCAFAGAQLFVKILPDYLSGNFVLKEQEESLASMTYELRKEDGKVNWNDDAAKIFRIYRAYLGWPGIFTFLENKRIKMTEIRFLNKNFTRKAGAITVSGQDIYVQCKNQSVQILKLKPEGKDEMTAGQYLLGHKKLSGNIFT